MRLALTFHSVEEWVAVRSEQARRLGCSATFIAWLAADIRARAAEPVEEDE